MNNGGSVFAGFSPSKCMRFIIRNTSGILADLIPCVKDSNNEAGFYDIIRDNFYGNAGQSGNLVAGPNVIE